MKLITGCFRSGTKYMSTMCQYLGLDMPHEKIGRHGIVSAYHAFENYKWDIYIQVVRNPLNVLATLGTMKSFTVDKIYPIIKSVDQNFWSMKNLMYVWLEWNKRISKKANFIFRVENLQNEWDKFCKVLRVNKKKFPTWIKKNINSRINYDDYKIWTIHELKSIDEGLTNNILNLAKKYGYKEIA